MPKKTEPKPPVEAIIHARGYFTAAAPGILEGEIDFPIRGAKPFRMERMPDDRVGERAKLICLLPFSEATLVLIEDMDTPKHWWGQIPIEGYHFFVRAKREGKRLTVEFLDCKQPVWCDEAIALLQEAA